MSDSTLHYFLGLGLIQREDAADITWAHAVNSRSKLTEALKDSTLMLEADILMRALDPKEPIMAHPPQTDSDITLEAWLQELKPNHKGIKLDFKSLDAVGPSVRLLEQIWGPSSRRPVWVNADVLPGPGGVASPLQPQSFLSAVGALPDHTVLSLGWTTGWTPGAENPGYSWEMVREMEQICGRLKNPVTFPVRAALMGQSAPQLLWLLQQSHRFSLTVWTGQSDSFKTEDLVQFRKQLEPHRVYYDLPEDQRSALAQTDP
ncbi:protein FAM151B isoform X2 [Boleophthalmus pectinirostris]|nr:protein FAM151B isoform X2 [Boleophthalmus pectinirostris]XP_055017442.1 protein FAM151B isoform X2 [Boleophthalmus pectinirostris]XP_055017443.1 protein FAM151B isoform X2 [Boleophthalmus pectinirostris]